MNNSVALTTALQLPAFAATALTSGRSIALVPKTFLRVGQYFALCPLPENSEATTAWSKTWARCDRCRSIEDPNALEILSPLTAYPLDFLQQAIADKSFFFLADLRVYHLAQAVEITINRDQPFVALPQPLSASTALPVLSDRAFAHRQQQLDRLQLPVDPILEELQIAVAQLALTQPIANHLDRDIQQFLGWEDVQTSPVNPDLSWIKTINDLGSRSKELDEGKSNYQAGTDFENIVRQALDFLGFTIEQAYKGGAGGLDLFCSAPYPLVLECKSGKKIPSGTTQELIRLGGKELGVNAFQSAAKLIISPGEPTSDVLKAAMEWNVSIINPVTLQKLAELKAKYPGCINLWELKEYLQPGQIDQQIEQYIQKVEQSVQKRLNVLQLVKNAKKEVGIDYLCGLYHAQYQDTSVSERQMHKILVELASPLVGCVGCKPGQHWQSDRFYFLRDLA